MGTLEAESIITETETPLEEPAGAKQQEEERVRGLKHHENFMT